MTLCGYASMHYNTIQYNKVIRKIQYIKSKTKSRGLKETMTVHVPCAAQHRGSVSPLYRN